MPLCKANRLWDWILKNKFVHIRSYTSFVSIMELWDHTLYLISGIHMQYLIYQWYVKSTLMIGWLASTTIMASTKLACLVGFLWLILLWSFSYSVHPLCYATHPLCYAHLLCACLSLILFFSYLVEDIFFILCALSIVCVCTTLASLNLVSKQNLLLGVFFLSKC